MTTNGTPDDCSIAPNAQYNLPAGNSDSWFKGGGVAVAGPNNQKGRSPLGNGGGSGVSGDSGGGGGANYGSGGVGGNRWCDYGTAAGGIGGNGLATFIENQNKVFFGGAGGSNDPLPVEFLSLNAECEPESVVLTWSTASEHNSAYFELEKSEDGEEWEIIHSEQAAGNSQQLLVPQAAGRFAA